MTRYLSPLERTLINRLQDDLPLVPHPFQELAQELGLSEEEVAGHIRTLRDDGLLTRFGPFFDAEALGGAFCLCAMAVPPDHKLNMWFVLATESQAAISATAEAIERDTGLPVLLFPKEREFFIGFRVNA